MERVDFNSPEITTGNEAEQQLINILRQFPLIENVWKDYSNSKFDIYYKLRDEEFVRGLQVKNITKKNNRAGYRVSSLNKYEKGMLIVCLNYLEGFGLIIIASESLIEKHVDISLMKNPRGKFSKMILLGQNFITSLNNSLRSAIIVDKCKFEESMTSKMLLEYESISRFIVFCQKHNIPVNPVENNGSPTDLIVGGLKAQMKYSSKARNPDRGMYFYNVGIAKSAGWQKGKIPYQKGDNDLYIIELGSYHGYFLILTEKLLIEHGYISTTDQEGCKQLGVFPFNYIEIQTPLTATKDIKNLKGNWTCNKALWCSSFTASGCL